MKFVGKVGGILLLAVVVYGSVQVGASARGDRQTVMVDPSTTEFRILQSLWLLALEYGNSEGHLASYQQMKQEGRIFFEFKNPYTGEDLKESCSRDAEPGSICIRLMDAYSGSVEMRGKDGETLIFGDTIPLNIIKVADWARGKKSRLIQKARAMGYTENQIQLVHLGRALASVVATFASFQGDGSADYWLQVFWRAPFDVPLRDPITGNLLTFDGRGFGNRVVFSEGSGPGRLRMQVLDDSHLVVFDGEFVTGGFTQTVDNKVLGGKEWRFIRFIP
ncbi:MAG: hypothetical protein V2G48_07915 [bacterium JZ-2024 1]